jgi:hypothetical protein
MAVTRAALLGLIAYALAVSFYLSRPASGQDMRAHEGTGAALGSIVITNQLTGSVEAIRTFDIGGVPVTVYYESTPNYQPGVDPRDIVRVTVPDGYIAVPADVLLPEGESVEIVIYEALLG